MTRPSMRERNAAIVTAYQAGGSMAEIARRHGIGRARVQQILKQAGAWRPYEKNDRTAFLGVNLTPAQKAKLRAEAAKRGISVSRLVSQRLS